MHSYSIDKKLRTTVAIGIFISSILISMFLRTLLAGPLNSIFVWLSNTELKPCIEFLSSTGIMPNFLEAAFIYTVLTFIYEKWIWKWPIIKKLHGLPDLNGHWEGTLKSSYNSASIPMTMDIVQSWSEISFKSTFPKTNSYSYSNVAAIVTNHNRGLSIYFGFHNDSKDIKSGMQSYDGYNILTLIDPDKIEAKYFNDRINPNSKIKGGNKGTFFLSRKPKKPFEYNH